MYLLSTPTLLLVALWCVVHAICGAIVGHGKERTFGGAILGLLFGPIGVITAFALDGRPTCPMCESRLNRSPRVCPCCRTDLDWDLVRLGIGDSRKRRAVVRQPAPVDKPSPFTRSAPPA